MILYINRLENDTFERIAVIDYATSVIWVKRFHAVGEFEIYIKASTELYELLNGDIFITRNDSNVAMYVEKIQLTTDSENGDYLTISGRSAECILSWRIVQRAVFQSVNDTAESIARTLITQQLLTQSDGGYIPWLSLGENHEWPDKVQRQFTGKILLDVIQDLCNNYNYGFEFQWTGSGFIINLYKGTDRSFDQTENSFVVFSPEFENLGNTEYTRDTSNYANAAIIGGEGEGNDRVFVAVYPEDATGFRRRVIYVDARQSSSDGGQISEAEYKTMLEDQAKEEISLRKVTAEFNGEILEYNSYVYGVDYNLGDKVSAVNEYGIRGNAQITEITEVEDETGYKLVPTLAEWAPIIYEQEG